MVLNYDWLFGTHTAEYKAGQLKEILDWCMSNEIEVKIAYDKIWFNSSRDYILYTLRWL